MKNFEEFSLEEKKMIQTDEFTEYLKDLGDVEKKIESLVEAGNIAEKEVQHHVKAAHDEIKKAQQKMAKDTKW
jgi:hypothetical protein